jgi:phage pi2 protein 07
VEIAIFVTTKQKVWKDKDVIKKRFLSSTKIQKKILKYRRYKKWPEILQTQE